MLIALDYGHQSETSTSESNNTEEDEGFDAESEDDEDYEDYGDNEDDELGYPRILVNPEIGKPILATSRTERLRRRS